MVEHRCEQLWPCEHKERTGLGFEHAFLPPLLAHSPGPFLPSAPCTAVTDHWVQAGHHLVCPVRRVGPWQGVLARPAGGRSPRGRSRGWGTGAAPPTHSLLMMLRAQEGAWTQGTWKIKVRGLGSQWEGERAGISDPTPHRRPQPPSHNP